MPTQESKQENNPKPRSLGADAILRAILWLLPSGFAILCPIAVIPFSEQLGIDYAGTFVVWVISSVAFTLATGWFHAFLAMRNENESEGVWSRTLGFFSIQLILVPVLVIAAGIALWIMNPPRFFC